MVDKGPGNDGQPKNPLFRCRIFVGNLPTDFLTKPEIVERFAKYGQVTEVSLHRGFAFVQFKNTEDASAAIKGEKGTVFKGSEIDCSFAKHEKGSKGPARSKSPPRGGGGGGGGRFDDRDKDRDRFRDIDRDRFPPSSYDRDRPYDRDGPPSGRGRDRSPLRDRFDDRYRDPYHRDEILRRERFYDERRSPPRRDPRDLDPYDRDRLPPLRDDPYRRDDLRDRDRDRDDPYFRDRERDVLSRDRDDPYRRDRDPFDRDRDPYDRDRSLFRDRDMRDRDLPPRDPLDRRGPPPPASADPSLDGPIDCEIIVVNKAQREYAELVQRRIKAVQLHVGIIYLNSEMSLSTALDDVSRRGVLYAIVLTSQHEMHKSVTVNILHGTPQEHRNMPLEDAMSLIGRNFDRYMQNLREKSGLPPGPVGPSRAAAPPPISPPLRQQAPPLPPEAAGPGPGAGSFSALGPSNVELTIPQLLNLLADGKQLTIDELARVIEFLQELRQRMIRDQGGNPSASKKDFDSRVGGLGPSGGSSGGYRGDNNGGRKEVDMDLDSDEDSGAGQAKPPNQNAQIQAKILSMIRPGGGGDPMGGRSSGPPTMTSATITDRAMRQAGPPPKKEPPGLPPQPALPPQPPPTALPPQPPQPRLPSQPPKPSNGGPANIRAQALLGQAPPPPPPPSSASSGMIRGPRPAAPPVVTSGNINFDNPNVKKALDNLIQSGPNLLRTIGQVSASAPTPPTASQPAATSQAASNLAAQQAMQVQQAQYAQYQAAAAQHQNAIMQAHMQAHAAYRQMNPGQQQQAPPGMAPQGYMQPMMQQGPRYGGPY